MDIKPENIAIAVEGHPSPDLIDLALIASNEGFWEWDCEGDAVFYSPRILEFLGVRPSDPLPHLFHEDGGLIHPEDRGAFKEAIQNAMSDVSVEVFAVNCRVWCGDELGWCWMRLRGVPVRDADNRVTRMAGSMIDITKRKDAEAKLREERQLFRLLVDNLPLNIYFKDLDSKFVLVNDNMASWFGKSNPEDLRGKSDEDFFDKEHAEAARRDEQRIISEREPVVGLVEKETRRGKSDSWVLTTKMPWIDGAGDVKGSFGISSDVTELVLAQRESARLAKVLKRRNRLIEEEMALAREIQSALLPRGGRKIDLVIGGKRYRATIDYRYIPSFGLAGDFFEILEIGPGVVGVIVGDVMGHGVRSALIVSMLRGMLEREDIASSDPSLFLERVNNGLCGILRECEVTMFATAAYVVIDLNEMTITTALAGHPSPYSFDESGSEVGELVVDETQRGPAMGLIPGATFPKVVQSIASGWRGLIYTDGVIEVEDDKKEAWLEERFKQSIGRRQSEGLELIMDGVLDDAREFSGGDTFDDDVCLVGVSVDLVKES